MRVSSNIWKLRVISAVRWFQLALPVLILFLQENNLSLFEAFVLQSVFSMVLLCCELPTGYLGDRFGWRYSLIIGSFVTVLAAAFFMLATHFWQFFIAEILMGLSYCFFSGSDSALLYETLVDMQQEGRYQQQQGSLLAFSYVSEAVAAVIGAALAFIFLRVPFIIEFIAFLFLIPLSFSLVKPQNSQSLIAADHSVGGRMRLYMDFSYILNFFLANKLILWVIVYSGFINFITLCAFWLMQVYFKQTHLPLYYLGLIWALLNIARSATSQWVCFFNYRLGTRKIFFIIPVVVGGCAFFMGTHIAIEMMVFGVVIQAMSGLKAPIVYALVNKHTDSKLRAAVLSLEGMVTRCFFIFLFPLMGVFSDALSLGVAFYLLAGLTLVVGLIFYFKFAYYYKSPHYQVIGDVSTPRRSC